MTPAYAAQPLSPLRKAIAARMTQATQSIPHYRITVDLAVDALVARRAEANRDAGAEAVTLNDCFVKAAGLALARHPDVNIQLVGNEIRRFERAAISVIVAVDGGLLTPILHDADRKPLCEIAKEARSLIARGRAGQLKMSEIAGGTFSISNLGAFGVDQFDAIINPPQCAILALGRARPMLVPDAEGHAKVVAVVTATASFDHRAIDGAGCRTTQGRPVRYERRLP